MRTRASDFLGFKENIGGVRGSARRDSRIDRLIGPGTFRHKARVSRSGKALGGREKYVPDPLRAPRRPAARRKTSRTRRSVATRRRLPRPFSRALAPRARRTRTARRRRARRPEPRRALPRARSAACLPRRAFFTTMLGKKMSGSSAKRRDDGRRSVAVVGSGIAGLSAAYLAHRNGARVTLFEAGETCGGHALTVDSSVGPVDLGFQVRSDRARPPTPSNPRATPRGGDHRRSRRPDPYPPRSMPSAPARVDDRSGPLTVTPRSRPPSPPHPRLPPGPPPASRPSSLPATQHTPGPKNVPKKNVPRSST